MAFISVHLVARSCLVGLIVSRVVDCQAVKAASVAGDPVLTGFDGQVFEFQGIPDHYYNLISEANVFQLSTLLKPATLSDHNGTYMKGLGLKHRNGKVVIETGADYEEDIIVTVNGETLEIENPETESTKRAFSLDDGGALEVYWQSHFPDLGPRVELRTPNLLVVVSMTAPLADPGGMLQPTYLNANVTVLREPSKDMEGILGETYSPGIHKKFPVYDDVRYEVDGYFGATLSQAMVDLMNKLNIPTASVTRQ